MSQDIKIVRYLDMIGRDRVKIPGCEPASSLTSGTMTRFSTCRASTIALDVALSIIPGSYVTIPRTYSSDVGGNPGERKFVLPEVDYECCTIVEDWFNKMKEHATETYEEQEAPCGDAKGGCFSCGSSDDSQSGYDQFEYSQEGNVPGGIIRLLNQPRTPIVRPPLYG